MATGCGDVLNLEDLQIAKKHQLFEAEVITGKQGGVSTGASIDYATNQVTGQVQKTMPAILRDIGFEPASFDFTTGGTLTSSDRNKAVLWPMADGGDGDWYYWEGALPKVIPAASTPSSAGGVASGTWRPVGDVQLRKQISDPNGATLYPELQMARWRDEGDVRGWGAACDADYLTGTGTDDTAAIQAAILTCGESGKKLYIPGLCLCTKELYIRKPIRISGTGPGEGYGRTGLVDYKPRSGLMFNGTGVKEIRTRRKYRASASDPQDDAISVGVNVQAEFVTLEDFCIYLWFDKTDYSANNFGADWDVGLFNGCRCHLKTTRLHIQGYWRLASEYDDVTRGIGYPQFSDPTGAAYDAGSVDYGADGRSMLECYYRGGKWAVLVMGALPKTDGDTGYGNPYYDELSGTTLSDTRGAFGFSDFSPVNCSFYGPEHHSNRRLSDSTGDYLTDTDAAGVMWIDGLAGNSSGLLQGMRFVSCRFTSGEAFRIRLDGVNRPVFIGSHVEINSQLTKVDGSALASTDYYGPVTATLRTKNILIQAIGGYSVNYDYFPDQEEVTNLVPQATDNTTRIPGFIVTTRGVSAVATKDLLLDAPTGQVVRARVNGVTVLRATATDLIMDATGNFRPVTTASNDIGRINNIFKEAWLARYRIGPAGLQKIDAGAGSPEGVLAAPVGSMWLRSDGGAGTTLYIKESGVGNTGWVAK